MSEPPSTALELAGRALAAGRALLDRVWTRLGERCRVPGRAGGPTEIKGRVGGPTEDRVRISGELLDQHQVACFDGAVSDAELTGAAFMLDYAAQVRAQSSSGETPLELRLALISVAEALVNLRGRISVRVADYGLQPRAIAETVDQADMLAFCNTQLSAANLAAVGETVRDREGFTGASMLEEKHEMMRETFRQFANDVVLPRAEEIHRRDQLVPPEILEQVKQLGCFGISIPERYDGLMPDDGEDTVAMCVVTEELSRGSLGGAGSLITRPEILARALLAGGTEAQKQYWLPKLAAGEPLCAVGVTEPDYGSDVAAMKFRATRTDGGWLLDGTKSWLTFAGKAGLLLVLARTDPDSSKGHKGLSIFIVEKPSFDGHDFEHTQQRGGTISGRAIATIGYRGMHSYETFFERYFVPEEGLLGGEGGLGKGFYYIMAGFAGGRIQTAARAVGLMQAAFERAVSYAAERKVFGKPVGAYQLTQVKLARMAALLCTVRRMTYNVAELMDRGEGAVEASMVKLYAGRAAEWLTREAMQIHGGMGYAEESAVSRYFVDARVLSIFEGAEETLALKVVARALIDRAR